MGILGPNSRLRPSGLAARRILAAFVIVATPALAGCGASFNASTNEPYQPAEGVSNRDGDVYTLDTLVVTDGEGNGTVVSRLVNEQGVEDQLTSFTAVDSAGTELTAEPLAEPIALGIPPSPDQSVQVGTEGLLRVTGDSIEAGDFITLTFTFDTAGPVTVDVPTVEVGTIYADIPVGAVPTPTDTPQSG